MKAVLGTAHVHQLPKYDGPINPALADPANGNRSPFGLATLAAGRLMQGTTDFCQFPGAQYGTLPYQAFGYGRGSVGFCSLLLVILFQVYFELIMSNCCRPTRKV